MPDLSYGYEITIAQNATFDPNGTANNQWQRQVPGNSNWENISQSTSNKYEVKGVDRGCLIRLEQSLNGSRAYSNSLQVTTDPAQITSSWEFHSKLPGAAPSNRSSLSISKDGLTLYARNNANFYKSTNFGASWTTKAVFSNGDSQPLSVRFNEEIWSGDIYSSGKIFYSTDKGETWTTINTGLSYPGTFQLGFDYQDEIAYAIGNGTSGYKITSGPPNGQGPWTTVLLPQISPVKARHHIVSDPNSTRLLLYSYMEGGYGPTLYRSGNSGASWTEVPGLNNSSPAGTKMFKVDGHVYLWNKSSHNASADNFYRLELPTDINRVSLSRLNATSKNPGNDLAITSDGAWWLPYRYQGVYTSSYSNDQGGSWQQVSVNPGAGFWNPHDVIYISSINKYMALGSNGDLYTLSI